MIRSLRSTMQTKPVTSNRIEPTRTICAIKEGWISKKGSKSFHSFRRRYIILWSNKRIDYYTDDTLSVLKGSVNLHDLHRRFIQRSDKIPKKDKSMHGFKIITKKRTWYFCVNDANIRDEWIQTIRDTIDEIHIKTVSTPSNTISTSSSTISTSSTPISLLKSKIERIKSQHSDKWNQLMAEQRIKARNCIKITRPDTKNNNTLNIISSDREDDCNSYYQHEHTENSDKEQGEIDQKQHINTNNKGFGEFNLKHEINYSDSEGSILGLSMSTTPIINAPNSIDISQQMDDITISYQLNDFWNLNGNKYIDLSDNALNAIYCSKHKCTSWISCFGTQIVENGDNKIWRIAIRSRNDDNNSFIANVVIGMSDIDIVKERGAKYGAFWNNPYFGYGFAGYSGKKLNGNNKSVLYANKYFVGDVITVSLNDNELIFMCNDKNNGVAFKVDDKRRFVLAVALCNNLYDLQICE